MTTRDATIQECLSALRRAGCVVWEPDGGAAWYVVMLPDGRTRDMAPHRFELLCFGVYQDLKTEQIARWISS